MVDVFSKEKRSKIMKAVKSKNTTPELKIRSILWQKKIRYRKHYTINRISIDIAFPKKKIAVFIDGCFWHGCKYCRNIPESNNMFWKTKIEKNKERDKRNTKYLLSEGWTVLRFWEHDINKNINDAVDIIITELESIF